MDDDRVGRFPRLGPTMPPEVACPFCLLVVPDWHFEWQHRAIQQAARWARNQNQSLRVYLKTREGQPFAGFWSDAEVDSADQQAAAQP